MGLHPHYRISRAFVSVPLVVFWQRLFSSVQLSSLGQLSSSEPLFSLLPAFLLQEVYHRPISSLLPPNFSTQ
jgi:hypothetical protein